MGESVREKGRGGSIERIVDNKMGEIRRKRDDRDRSSYDSRAERGPTTHSSRGELVKPLPSVPAGMPAPPTAGSAPVGAMRMIEVVANDRLGGKGAAFARPSRPFGQLPHSAGQMQPRRHSRRPQKADCGAKGYQGGKGAFGEVPSSLRIAVLKMHRLCSRSGSAFSANTYLLHRNRECTAPSTRTTLRFLTTKFMTVRCARSCHRGNRRLQCTGMCAHEMGFAGAKQSHSRTGVSRCIETLYTLPQCISLIALASARLISWW